MGRYFIRNVRMYVYYYFYIDVCVFMTRQPNADATRRDRPRGAWRRDDVDG